MKNSNSQILKALKSHLLSNYGNAIQEVILFGSRAKENASDASDYDVLIVLNKPYTGEDENKILDLCYDIDLEYDILLDVHILSSEELHSLRGKQPIYADAIKHGVYA